MNPADALELFAEVERRRRLRILRFFPAEGPYRRDLYPKHLAFMAAGRQHRERLFLKANRVGGTEMGAYELTLHLTGRYDDYAPWWQGRRFDAPIKAWVAGDTGKTTRDILQFKLLGQPDEPGGGMVPPHLIAYTRAKQGLADAFDSVYVQHVSGGYSLLQFRSYDQGRRAFQGTEQHLIWLDEECPQDVYGECLLRTAATGDFGGGLIMLTFTPLYGLTPLILDWLPGGQLPETT
jgi:phage terminase large subunit-like protein